MSLKRTLVLFLLLINTISRSQSINDGLLIYYPFDGNALDYSGNNNHGIVNASPTSDRNDIPNSAFYFNGVNAYIDVPNATELKPTLPISVSFWVNFSSLSPSVLTTDFAQDIHTGVWVSLSSDGRIAFNYGDGGPATAQSRRTKIGTTLLEIGKWYHILGVIRGPFDMDIFINGINDCGQYTGTGGSLTYSTNPGSIGRKDAHTSFPPYYFHGKIDDLRYWNREVDIADLITPSENTLSFQSFTLNNQIGETIIDNQNSTITTTVNCETDITSIIPNFSLTENTKAYVGNIQQMSEITSNDFSFPLQYSLRPPIGCDQRNWTVNIIKETSEINPSFESFHIENQQGSTNIDSEKNTITITVPCIVNLASIQSTFTLTENTTAYISNTQQISGVSSNDFSMPILYRLKTNVGCKQTEWIVTVVKEISNINADFESFFIKNQKGKTDINYENKTIRILLPCAEDLTKLTPAFSLSGGAEAQIHGVHQESNKTKIDFTNPVIYSVINYNECSASDWTVYILTEQFDEALLHTKTSFISFQIEGQTAPTIIDSTKSILIIELPCPTDVTKLIPNFTITENTIATIGGIEQRNNDSEVDFSKPVEYTIHNSEVCYFKTWVVQVKKQSKISMSDINVDSAYYYIPNVITPNGDGKNETFILGEFFKGSELLILNRYGKQVHKSSNYQNNFNGDHLSTGVYFYVVKNICVNDVIRGSLTIAK